MTTIVTRAGKGSPLTNAEVDANFTNLNDAKIETLTSLDASVTITGTGLSRDLSVVVSGAGNVVGPASATDNAIARFDATTGKLIQNSIVTIDDNGNANNVNAITFDTTPTNLPTTSGSLFWDDGNKTPSVILNSNTSLQLGQENVALVYNGTGSTIAKGAVVAVSGAQGQRPSVVLADADSEALSAATLGIAAEAILNGAEGFICTFGLVRGINTSAFVAGDDIYLSQTAGGITATRPTAPAHTVFLGWVISVNASSGELFVNINNGWELNELHNVLITSPASGNTLIYDATAGVWKNANITGSTGLSVTNGAGTIALANTGVTSAVAGTGISVSGATGVVTVTNTAPDQVVTLTGGGATSITGTYPNFTISSVNTTYALATSTTLGLIELGSDTAQTVAANAVTATASRTYALQVNAAGQGVINVPWTDTNSGGTVTSVGGTGTVNGITLTGSVTSSGNLTLGGTLSNVSLSTQVTGTLPIANGGTGQTTASAGFNALSPITTTGDLIIGNGSNSATRLAIGTNGQVLTSNGTTATWTTPSSGGSAATATTLGTVYGVTGASTSSNVAYGYDAGVGNAAGSYNTIVGTRANRVMPGNQNSQHTAVGWEALNNSTAQGMTGPCTVVGAMAMGAMTTSYPGYGTAVGFEAMKRGSSASTAVGHQALTLDTGGNNSAFGYTALASSTAAYSNSAFGHQALTLNTGGNNSAFGSNALSAQTSGTSNSAFGSNAGSNITTGSNNIVIGDSASASSATVSNEATWGNSSITRNRFWGALLMAGTNAGTSGQVLTSAGAGVAPTWGAVPAGSAATPTARGTVFGSMGDNASTYFNLGFYAGGNFASSLQYNTNVGYNAGYAQTFGNSDNTSVGYNSQASNSGSFNTSVGSRTLYNNTGSGGTSQSTAIGYYSLYTVTGANNTALGYQSGASLTTGTNNILLGHNAGNSGTNNLTTGTNNIIIGRNGTASSATVSNENTFGNSSSTSNRFWGDMKMAGANAGTSGQVLTSAGAGVSPTWTTPSSGGSAATPTALGTLFGDTDSATPFTTTLGYNAGASATGVSNTFIGYESGFNTTSGTGNTAVGRGAFRGLLSSAPTGHTAVGFQALNSPTDAIYSPCTAVGYESQSNSTGSFGGNSTSVGYRALKNGGYNNTAVGHQALAVETGNNSCAFGSQALLNSVGGSGSNNAFGVNALQTNITGSSNSAFGNNALTLATGSGNAAFGNEAGSNLTTGTSNILIGNGAQASSATVSNEFTHGSSSIASNRFFGDFKMGGSSAGTSGQVLTSAGPGVSPTWTTPASGGSAATPTALGTVFGETDSATPFTTTLGRSAGAVTTGVNNTFVGYESGVLNTTGTDNTAVGFKALDANTTGGSNTAVGREALGSNTGAGNTAVGARALFSNTTGYQNSAFGLNALYNNIDGYGNIAVGQTALNGNTSGYKNTAIGLDAGLLITTGGQNTVVGAEANSLTGGTTTGLNNILIGYRAQPTSATVSNENTFGNSSSTSNRFWGDMKMAGANAGTSGQVLTSAGAGVAPTWATVTGTGTVTSVAATVPAFLSISGSPITGSGTLAISYSGTALPVANGGTGSTSAPAAGGVIYGTGTAYAVTATGTSGQVLTSNGTSAPTWATVGGTGTVTSVAATVPSFLSISGSPITSSGTLAISYSGTALPVANGGTGSSSGDLSNCTADGTNSVGFRNIPQISQSANYTLVLTDNGKHIFHPAADTTARTYTIPANSSVAFPIGTAITFVNQNAAGVITIAITTDTMRLAGAGTTGSRSLAANGVATCIKISSTEWIISGVGLT